MAQSGSELVAGEAWNNLDLSCSTVVDDQDNVTNSSELESNLTSASSASSADDSLHLKTTKKTKKTKKITKKPSLSTLNETSETQTFEKNLEETVSLNDIAEVIEKEVTTSTEQNRTFVQASTAQERSSFSVHESTKVSEQINKPYKGVRLGGGADININVNINHSESKPRKNAPQAAKKAPQKRRPKKVEAKVVTVSKGIQVEEEPKKKEVRPKNKTQAHKTNKSKKSTSQESTCYCSDCNSSAGSYCSCSECEQHCSCCSNSP